MSISSSTPLLIINATFFWLDFSIYDLFSISMKFLPKAACQIVSHFFLHCELILQTVIQLLSFICSQSHIFFFEYLWNKHLSFNYNVLVDKRLIKNFLPLSLSFVLTDIVFRRSSLFILWLIPNIAFKTLYNIEFHLSL